MANQFVNTSWVPKEILRIMRTNCQLLKLTNTDYKSEFTDARRKIGATISVERPAKYTIRQGLQAQPQASISTFVPMTIQPPIGVDLDFDIMSQTLNMDDKGWQNRIKAAVVTIAAQVDAMGFSYYNRIADVVGTPGLITSGAATSTQLQNVILQARQRLTENLAPDDGSRAVLLAPAMTTPLVSGLTPLFNPQGTISKAFSKGALGDGVLGFNFAEDQNATMHTTGTATGTPQAFSTAAAIQGATNSVQSDGSTPFPLATAALSGTLTAGTAFTIPGVYNVNDKTKVTTGTLKNFVLVANAAGGATSISIYPYPVFSGPFQNCTSATGAIPASSACTTLNGAPSTTYPNAWAIHPDALGFVSLPLGEPAGLAGTYKEISDDETNLRMSVWTGSDIKSGTSISRIELCCAFAWYYPEWAVRITG